jgi:transcriptional regulator with XRE-family HTH domain
MDWTRIRDHYATLFEQSGLTQEDVAAAAHLHAQTAISKLLDNQKRGPSVETFARAVLGLGVTLTSFFAGLEQAGTAAAPSVTERLQTLERALDANRTALAELQHHHGRPHVDASLSSPGLVPPPTVGLGVPHFHALVAAHLDLLKHHLEGLADHLARDFQAGRDAHRRPARTRARARPRHRKSA